MADIRINALATTAASTASDDFIAVDGSANGTRKLNAYSPTFGGNLTVSGGSTSGQAFFNSAGSYGFIQLTDAGSTAGNALIGTGAMAAGASVGDVTIRQNNDSKAFLVSGVNNNWLKVTSSAATILGNLTVSGGTIDITSASSAKISGSTAGSSAALSLISNAAANYRSLQFGYGATPTYLWKIGYQGGTSNDQLNFESGAGVVAQLTQAGALTLSSNLTVSGTGLSSITGGLKAQSVESVGTPASYNSTGGIIIAGYAGSSYALVKAYSDGGGTEKALTLQSGSGAVLLGTTTDSSNGKIQLATHTTSAGGIGFGTDVSLFRGGVGQLVLSHASVPIFSLYEASTNTGEFYSSSGNVVLGSKVASSSLTFRTVNTTALTLDSTQNATFAGKVRSNGTGFGVGADSDANTPVYALASVNGTFGALIKNTNAGSSAFAGVAVEADSGVAALRQYSTAHGVWAGKTLLTSPSGGTGLVLLTNGSGDNVDIYTNGTLAATFDTSQNATFAGFVGIKDGMTAPSATSGTAKIYVDTADGDLKVIFGDGTVKTIVTD